MSKRKAIVRAAYATAKRLAPAFGAEGQADLTGQCLLLAAAVIQAADAQGLRLVLQAGTTYWPRVTPETDDGTEPNVFGYEWEASLANLARLEAGVLPEMHVWAADPVRQEIVDLATGHFPAQCRRILGCGWKAPRPPEWFWGPLDKLPRLACYEPSLEATQVAARMLQLALAGSRSR